MDKFILGTAQLGLKYGIVNSDGKPTFQKSLELIRECIDNNIYQFDTAQAYGNAEKILGDAQIQFAPFMEKPIRIITKLELPINLEKSMDHLKTNILDTVLLHNFEHLEYNNSEIWKQLQKYKAQKRIRKIGVSVYTISELEKALQYPNMDIIQVPLNVFTLSKLNNNLPTNPPTNHPTNPLTNPPTNPSTNSTNNIIHLIKKTRVEIHVRSIFLQGILFLNSTDNNYHEIISRIPNGEKLAKYLDKLKQTEKDLNISRCQLLISCILNQEWINGIIMGVDNINQLRENVKTFELSTGYFGNQYPLESSGKMTKSHFYNRIIKDNLVKQHKLDQLLEFCKDIPESILDPRLWK